jgi:deazaflavin-dependent oxidoreductase (nitroreductase family)
LAATRNPLIKALWSLHAWVLQASRGRIGGEIVGLPVLLLNTVGRKTGKRHVIPLCYLMERSAYIVIGSNGGADTHADWYLNLRARKQAWIEVEGERIEVTARQLRGDEAEHHYHRFANVYFGYDRYQRRTKREIPVIVLEPGKSGNQ